MERLSRLEKWIYYPVAIAWTILGFDVFVKSQSGKPLWPAIIYWGVALGLWAYPLISTRVPFAVIVMRIILWVSAWAMLAWSLYMNLLLAGYFIK